MSRTITAKIQSERFDLRTISGKRRFAAALKKEIDRIAATYSAAAIERVAEMPGIALCIGVTAQNTSE